MNAQLNADMVALKAANYRVKMTMGADRFHAAEAALAADTAVRPAAPRDDDGADTIALARAAGIGRFAAVTEDR